MKLFGPCIHFVVLVYNYRRVNRTEIWTEESINSTIRQIKYCEMSDFFASKEDKNRVCEQDIIFLENLEDRLEDQYEDLDNKMNFYVSNVELGGNSFIFDFLNQKHSYINFNVMNMVSTSDEVFIEEVLKMKKSLISKSIKISGQSEIIRRNFFKTMKDAVKKIMA